MIILILAILAQWQVNMANWHMPEESDHISALASAANQKLCEMGNNDMACVQFCIEAWQFADFDEEYVYCKETIERIRTDLNNHWDY